MNLLSPGFLLAGAALASIPVIIHILNRRRYREQKWAAMEYLLRAMRKNRKRLKFEQWLLLAVRCLLVGLLGLALARPMGCAGDAASALARQSGLHVIVIDDSYSMAYEAERPTAKTHLDQAKLLARSLLDRMTPGGDAVAIVTASKPAKTVFPAGYDLEAAKAAISRIDQTATATDLPGALHLASQLAHDASAQPLRTLDLLTDGTRSSVDVPGSELKDAARDASAGFTRIALHDLGLANQQHAAALSLEPASALTTARTGQSFRLLARSFGDDATRGLQWKLDDQVIPGGGDVHLTASSDPQVPVDVKFGRGGPRVVQVTLVGADRLKIDAVRWRAVAVEDRVKVLIVEGERGGGPLGSSGAFLRLALAPPGGGTGKTSASPFDVEAISDLELPARALAEQRVVILAGVPQIAEATARQLKSFVDAGGVLIVFLGEGVTSEGYAAMVRSGLTPGALVKRVASDEKGVTFDFKPEGNLHPMLEAFRREPKSGLDTARTYTYWQLETGPKVERVLDFANDHRDPAITAQSVGAGRVVFVTTSAGADGWTSLPGRLAFVSLMQEMVRTSLTARDAWMNLTVGDRLELPSTLKLAGTPSLADPAGKPIAITLTGPPSVSLAAPAWKSDPLPRPGVYTLRGTVDPTTGEPLSTPIAVNVDALAEADIRTLTEPALRKALGDVPFDFLHDQLASPESAADESRGADFGWIVMLCVLGFVGMESVMAMRFGHSR
jgi:hypothetical protein